MNVLARSCCRLVAMLMLLIGLAAATGSVQAQGNSDAAHMCQKGGYQHLYRSHGNGLTDGSGFRNAGECTSYAAQGGVFYEVDPSISAESYLDFVLMQSRVNGQGFSPNGHVMLDVEFEAASSVTVVASEGGGFSHVIFPPLVCTQQPTRTLTITATDIKSGRSATIEHTVVCPLHIDGTAFRVHLTLAGTGTGVTGYGFTPNGDVTLSATRSGRPTVTETIAATASGIFGWTHGDMLLSCAATTPEQRVWSISATDVTTGASAEISYTVTCPLPVSLRAENYELGGYTGTTIIGEGFSVAVTAGGLVSGTAALTVNGTASTIAVSLLGTIAVDLPPVDCATDPNHAWIVSVVDNAAPSRSASITSYPCGAPAP
jgi:hypothetical protein